MNKPFPCGVIAAVPTPVTKSGEPDLDRFLEHCRWMLDNGCDGLNVLGTTGEANSFGLETRKRIMSAAALAIDASRMMVGTGTPDAESTTELTRFAAQKNYAAALVLPPYYYKPLSDDGLFLYFKNLCKATAKQPIPIYLYNFPALTGVPFGLALVERLATGLNGRIRGIKDSSGDLSYCRNLVEILPDFDVFPSSETCLATARKEGFAGCISATVNITSAIAQRIWQENSAHDRESDAALIFELRKIMASQSLIPAIKYMLSVRQDDVAWQTLLPPLVKLNFMEKKALGVISDHFNH